MESNCNSTVSSTQLIEDANTNPSKHFLIRFRISDYPSDPVNKVYTIGCFNPIVKDLLGQIEKDIKKRRFMEVNKSYHIHTTIRGITNS